ncbi:hypothetical protein [Amycolatopsis sp. NPDC021455]|uniref:hypothetical protein n=1 Tax=Amycolatopsis sp. NPDC021455 TaxID=3154901 RepID=UPI0033F012CA
MLHTAVEKFAYNGDGTFPAITMTTAGPPRIGTLDPFTRQEAETIAWESGVETQFAGGGGYLFDVDWWQFGA